MQISVPPVSAINAPLNLVVDDLTPGDTVRIAASCVDGTGAKFETTVAFRADEDGVVDCDRALPVDAEWVVPDSRGLLWTLRGRGAFSFAGLSALDVSLKIRSSDGGLGAHMQRRLPRVAEVALPATVVDPQAGITHCVGYRAGDANGAPTSTAPAPGVVLLGGDSDAPAHILAAEGFTVFRLDWQAPCDVPAVLEVLRQCAASPAVDSSLPLALIGSGRGAELALLLATMDPSLIGPVVAHSPTEVVTAEPSKGKQQPTWLNIAQVPIMAPRLASADMEAFVKPELAGQPWNLAPYYRAARENSDLVAAAIQVEKLSGPVLLTAGSADAVWDSAANAQAIAQRATAETFVCTYPEAGHGVGYPFTILGAPQLTVGTLAGSGGTGQGHSVALGGTANARAHGAKDSCEQVLSFLCSAYGMVEGE